MILKRMKSFFSTACFWRKRMELSNKRILITGASGFIGSHLVESLISNSTISNFEILALSRTRGKLDYILQKECFTFTACDLLDSEKVTTTIVDFNPHIIFHMASQPDAHEGHKQSLRTVDVNIQGTINLLDAFSRSENPEVFVYGDSAKVYGTNSVPYCSKTPVGPNSSYAISKIAGWEYSKLFGKLHGFNAVSVRPTLIYGTRQPQNLINFVIDCVLRGDEGIRLDGGLQTRAPLYIDDAVSAYLMSVGHAYTNHGSVINVSGSEELSVHSIANMIVDIMKAKTSIIVNQQKVRPTEMERSYSDLSEARDMIGWSPKFKLSGGLKVLIDDLTIAA
jgi:nucleoside-diphosphate-sugar epimerase